MGETSVIEWTDSTWNPWRGCDKVSPGCADCYMFRDQRRYGKDPSVVVRAKDGTFNAPLSRSWERVRTAAIVARGRHLVFTCSWSDWFHEDADPWRDEAWEVIRKCPQSTFQILTKRPQRILDHLPEDWGDGYPNVWMGVTIENRRFVERADRLREVPARVRFISAEPLLGPLDGLNLSRIDWVIGGGESGGRIGRRLVDQRNVPREDRLPWIRDLRDACLDGSVPCEFCDHGVAGGAPCKAPGCREGRVGGTAFLFKQWGGPTPTSGGRVLDGRTWDEMPPLRLRDLGNRGEQLGLKITSA